MATSQEKVRAVYPGASHQIYRSHGGDVHYLIWSDRTKGYGKGCRRLGEGKTQSAAWVDAAKRLAHPPQTMRAET